MPVGLYDKLVHVLAKTLRERRDHAQTAAQMSDRIDMSDPYVRSFMQKAVRHWIG